VLAVSRRRRAAIDVDDRARDVDEPKLADVLPGVGAELDAAIVRDT